MGYWDDIEDLPIWNYHKVSEKADLSFLHDGKGDFNEKKAKEIWDDVRQQYNDRYGLDHELKDYYDTIKRVTELKSEMIITKERFLINEIRILEAQIKDFESGESVRHTKIYQQLSRFLGYRFNPKKESVVSYKETLIMIEEENSQAKIKDNG